MSAESNPLIEFELKNWRHNHPRTKENKHKPIVVAEIWILEGYLGEVSITETKVPWYKRQYHADKYYYTVKIRWNNVRFQPYAQDVGHTFRSAESYINEAVHTALQDMYRQERDSVKYTKDDLTYVAKYLLGKKYIKREELDWLGMGPPDQGPQPRPVEPKKKPKKSNSV
jgi:hypothetical protein